MERIKFEALPSTKTPVNPTNLNQMQDNVDNAKIEKTTYNSIDLNTINSTEIGSFNTSCTNTPFSDAGGYIETLKMSENYAMQIATHGINGLEYKRLKIAGTWGAWKASEVEIDIVSLFQNGWSRHYQFAKCFKKDNIVYLNFGCSGGTATKILDLPEGFRPSVITQVPIIAIGATGILTINPSGEVTCTSNLVNYQQSALYINCTFEV